MGYIMFGLSLFPVALADGNPVLLASSAAIAIVGTVLHIITHAASKGLFFLTAGGVMHQTEERDIRKMGGLAGKMPFSAVSGTIAALSIAGAPPLACFVSEFFIFVGAFQIMALPSGSFYIIPTALMLIATVFSLAYSLRFVSKVFLDNLKMNRSRRRNRRRTRPRRPRLQQQPQDGRRSGTWTQNRRHPQLHEGVFGNPWWCWSC